ncbi:hypothetical protein [Streptacidiphilus monticola]|uniref:Uncharacterized protein n=1 Tax=Streptacidiphilus monticola TaxID=2161674 RepID=A0ABW1G0E2_9ACTN
MSWMQSRARARLNRRRSTQPHAGLPYLLGRRARWVTTRLRARA